MITDLKSPNIVILGMHQATLDRFDYSKHKDDEIWCMAHHRTVAPYATRCFEAHSPEIVIEHGGMVHVQRLKMIAEEMPLYTMWDWPLVLGPKHYVAPPIYANAASKPYVESSIGYMMGAAMCAYSAYEEGGYISPENIYIYGCDLDAADEYAYQRPNMLYLIGLAEGQGITVHIPDNSSIFKSSWTGGIYGHKDNINDITYYLK